MKNKENNGKNNIKLEIKELCNETRQAPDILFTFPTLPEEELEKAPPKDKISIITEYLKQQKQSYRQYKSIEQQNIEKDHKKELFLLKYNTVLLISLIFLLMFTFLV